MLKNNKKIKSGVYFVYNADTKLTKIGCSNNIERRFGELQKSNSHLGYDVKLELLDWIYCENYFGLEKYIHKICKKYRKINEWFDISRETVNTLKNNINVDNFLLKNKVDYIKNKNMIYRFDKGEYVFNSYVKADEFMAFKLTLVEEGVYSRLCKFIQYPTNCVMVNGQIPSIEILMNIMDLKERSLRGHLKTLCDKGLIKMVQCGHKKSIYVNPQYTASGKDLDIETLQIFNLIECDEEKVNSYL